MEFNQKKQPIVTATTLLNATDEKPVDIDVVLPDYCPDVAAILCCELIPSIIGSGWNGDKLTADGTALVRVMYLDEERRCIHTYEVSQAFSASFLTDGRKGETAMEVTAKTEYIHCRAVSPRRLDIHGALHVHAAATSAGEQAVLAAVEEDGVFVKTDTVIAGVPSGNAQKPFSVNEVVSGADGVEQILRSTAVPTVSEVKVLAGKIIVKGDVTVDALLLYDGQSGKTVEKRFVLPFSQMLDLPCADENTVVDATVNVLSHGLKIEEDGGEKSLCSHTKLSIAAQAWKEESTTVLTDAYHTAMPVTTESETVTATRLIAVSDEPISVSQTLDLPDGVMNVISVWCEAQPIAADVQEKTCTCSGRLTVHLLATDGEETVQYYTRTVDFSREFSTEGDREEHTVLAVSTDAGSESRGELTVNVSLCVHRRQYAHTQTTVLIGLAGDEADAYPADTAAVKIVYADEGESLWNVAKAAHTSVEALKAENELEADTLEKRTMLLVPLA